jgi:DNA polymerase-3 subunit gamma/tau
LEIDGASNRGIDEIRQLRSNVNIRPSRSRFKIYIIDEVHMLTTPAFNALLKTLEEPPEHVKFIFCTTDPEKVPITVLSRCQRFDFPPVETESIVDRLRFIVESESVTAEEEALQLLARRAGGSMRDSQSLLEQLLSFCGERITPESVHQLLGTADSGRLSTIAAQLIARDAAAALGEIDKAIREGVEIGQLAEQLLGHFRDMMAVVVGCDADMLLHSPASEFSSLRDTGEQLGLETLLAVVQILDQSLTRMRQSTHARTLLEVATIRICNLESLDELSSLIAQLGQPLAKQPGHTPRSGSPTGAKPPSPPSTAQSGPSTASQKKNPKLAESAPSSSDPALTVTPLSADSAASVWKQALKIFEDMTADHGSRYERVAIIGPNQLAVYFSERYTLDKERCERPERKARIEEALLRVTGQRIRVTFETTRESSPQKPRKPVVSRRQRMREKEQNPLVRKALELFEGEITDLDEPRDQ